MIGLRDESAPPVPPESRVIKLTPEIFCEGGLLQSALALEHRPQQEQMAYAVAGALQSDAALLFEAGTGVGKSLAYLVPGLIHASDLRRQLIVSTHTIALQEQIQHQDLPLCRRVFGSKAEWAPYAAFKSAVLVGKGNYLCTTRLAHALAERASLFSDEDYGELQRIAGWAEQTATGLRHELQPPPRSEVWELVNADSAACSRKYCEDPPCFYQRARGRLREAHLIIVNHALLFSLINAAGPRSEGAAAESPGVLFPGDFLVLDEAHTVPEVATAHFGLGLSSYGMDRALKFLYNPRTKRGLLRRHGGAEAFQLVADALAAAKHFFDFVEQKLLSARSVVRLREPAAAEPLLDGPLQALQRLVLKAADALEDGRERDELLEQRSRLSGLQAGVAEWLCLGSKEHVYWAERSGKRQTVVTLRGAPVDVAPALRRHLFGCGVSVVCTSATLALADEMGPMAARLGAEAARTGLVHSPFDFARNMRVYVAADVPLPSGEEARLSVAALADYIAFCSLRVTGGTLVLFTSYSDLRAVAAILAPKLAAAGRTLLLQGDALSRTELTRQMRGLGNAVLFGTDSFWTGVDVPGAALAQVIVTRLPFDPPDHPIAEAQAEKIRDRGGSPFHELTLPDALIKFRQGVGRLIRTQRDRGVITILDARVLVKSYGRLFLESLPQPEYVRLTCAERDELFRPFN